MIRKRGSLVPEFSDDISFLADAWEACPGKGVDYPRLYGKHYGRLPEDWCLGIVDSIWTGHAADRQVRSGGASGGVVSAVLVYLLKTGKIDGAVLVKQDYPSPGEASWFIARTKEEILSCAQSVYVPTSTLDSMSKLTPGERYAMTCLPEQSAALRVLQHEGQEQANQIHYVIGLYTGTALESGAVRALLRSNGIADDDAVRSLKWRAGEWPGYLEIHTASGRVVRSKKVYYNYLIPFYITQASLQSMDFANEFADLSVGDAWSPKYESLGQGFSVVLSRQPEITELLLEMSAKQELVLEQADPLTASGMHGHMIDFKKRGGFLRNRLRRALGASAPDNGLRPLNIGFSRVLVEIVIDTIFFVCRRKLARRLMEMVPESFLWPFFNRMRLIWKNLSKPAKRKGLRELKMLIHEPSWRKTLGS
jgi:coenzyme F420 hydrogenase subunit beta